jgi:zinc transporter, ZIP family
VGGATALATGLGALPVWLFGGRAELIRPVLWGMTVGLISVASVWGLLRPALDEGGTGAVGGLVVGAAFLVVARLALRSADPSIGGLSGAGVRRSALVFAVLFVHSLPEGFAIGTAYAADETRLGVFVILAIALQNVPEGTSVAIPMDAAGFGKSGQFWAAVATSAPQPAGAVVAFLLVAQVESLLPFSFAFAAGAMLALVAVELVPQALATGRWGRTLAGALIGGALMVALAAAIGV